MRTKYCFSLISFLFALTTISLNANGQTKIYVDSSANGLNNGNSWKDAYKSLMPALVKANSRTDTVTIYIAKGTYYPGKNNGDTTNSRDSSFRIFRTKIKLEGGYANGGGGNQDYRKYPVVLSGDIGKRNDSSDNSYHILTIVGKSLIPDDSTAEINGINFKGGTANAIYSSVSVINGVNVYNDRGGAIYYAMGGTGYPQIDKYNIFNCEFSGNNTGQDSNSPGNGGAVYCYGYNSQLIRLFLSHCLFNNNKAYGGGALACYQYNAIGLYVYFSNCTLIGNSAKYGGATYQTGETFGGTIITMDNCLLKSNSSTDDGGAIYTDLRNDFSSGSFTATNSDFIKNSAVVGGAIYINPDASAMKCINCNFFQNSAAACGAVSNGGSFENCFFYENKSYSGTGGAICNVSTVKNCVFAENKSSSFGAAISNATFGYGSVIDAQITNSTFLNNRSAINSANAVYISNYKGSNTATFNNCIIWRIRKKDDNDSVILYQPDNAAYSCQFILNNTLLQGKAPAATILNGNSLALLNKQPLFRDYTNLAGPDGIWGTSDDGLELRPNSPAVNAGNNSYISDIKKDITGIKRIQCDTVDLGAYERKCSAPLPVIIADANTISSGRTQVLIYPNPNNGNFTIQLPKIERQFSVIIYDMSGRKVYEYECYNTSSAFIQLDGFKGVCLVHIKGDDIDERKQVEVL